MSAYISSNRNLLLVIFIFLGTASSPLVYAKPTLQSLPVLTCESITRDINFAIRPGERSLSLTMKNYTHNLPFHHAWVSKKGERWKVFANNEISVSTTYPYDNYFIVQTVRSSGMGDVIASAFCNKLR